MSKLRKRLKLKRKSSLTDTLTTSHAVGTGLASKTGKNVKLVRRRK